MSQTVDLDNAKTQVLHLVERAAAGEKIIIAKAGRPMARLAPIRPAVVCKPGLHEGLMLAAEDPKIRRYAVAVMGSALG